MSVSYASVVFREIQFYLNNKVLKAVKNEYYQFLVSFPPEEILSPPPSPAFARSIVRQF